MLGLPILLIPILDIMKKYVITAFYKFVTLENFAELKPGLLGFMRENNILGTIILAAEGINGGAAALAEDMDKLYAYLRQDLRLADLIFKECFDDFNPFDKAKVKLRNEIVTMGVPGLDPIRQTGQHLSPHEWNQLITDPEVIVVDTRNTYEVELGSFKGAVNPNTENFRDFPEYVNKELLNKKDKKIAMFCTGGIRCEKSTAYLLSLGFDKVYQLQGGILNYFHDIPAKDSLWDGACFVFDERIAVAEDTEVVKI
jgi:UPF0176 protein